MRYLVLDMDMVQGVDPSAAALLGRLRRLLLQRSVRVLLANLQPELVELFLAHSVLDDGPHGGLFHTVDTAVEWCEDELLIIGSPPHSDGSESASETKRRTRTAPWRAAAPL